MVVRIGCDNSANLNSLQKDAHNALYWHKIGVKPLLSHVINPR